MTDRSEPAVRNGEICPVSWNELHAADWPVLWCRREGCGGEVYADGPPERIGQQTWYEATCRTCRTGYAMPDGRLYAAKHAPHRAAAPAYTPAGT